MKSIALALLLLGGAASAEDRFGSKGTISPAGSVGFSYVASGSNGSYFASLDPAAMIFLIDGLAVGGSLHLSYRSSSSDWGYGLGPSLGWNLWVGERASLFPQAVLSANWERFSGMTAHLITAQVFAPVLFHVVPHFFLGAGPFVLRELSVTSLAFVVPSGDVFPLARPLQTIVGLQSVIGGWF
jgi:hypothetical protein